MNTKPTGRWLGSRPILAPWVSIKGRKGREMEVYARDACGGIVQQKSITHLKSQTLHSTINNYLCIYLNLHTYPSIKHKYLHENSSTP